jgi:hypothetical protein
MATRKKWWKVSTSREVGKLVVAEDGWNLPGSDSLSQNRTRGRNVQLTRPPTPDNVCASVSAMTTTTTTTLPIASVDSNDKSLDLLSTLTQSASTPLSATKQHTKPQQERVIVELNAVTDIVLKHLQKCPKCKSTLIITFPTEGITSGCQIACSNEVAGCTYIAAASLAMAYVPLPNGSINTARNTDYALNIAFILSLLQSSDGGTEAARILGMCGLPNSTTMQARMFGKIEETIAPIVEELVNEILFENLKVEVSIFYGNKQDDDGTKLYDLWLEKKLPQNKWLVVRVSGDMGWNQKGSRHTYNSNSGQAFLIASETRKPIAKHICSKSCSKCKSWFRHHNADEDILAHECVKNFDGSSGSMEPTAILVMYKMLFDKYQVIVGTIITDDDSSIKAKLKWSNDDHMRNNNTVEVPKIINRNGKLVTRPDKGGVPYYMPEPKFLADPNHQQKMLANELYALEQLPKAFDKKNLKKKMEPNNDKDGHNVTVKELCIHGKEAERLQI